MRMRVRTTITAVSALGLLTVLTACDGGAITVEAHPASTPPASSAPASPAAPSTSAPASTNAKPVVPADSNDSATSFKAEFSIQRQDVGMIMLTNTSGHTVTVQGWPALTFTNAHGDKTTVPTQKVEVPGPGPSISVVAGGSVFAPVAWTDGDKGDTSTIVADGVQVTPPKGKKPVDTKFVGADGTAAGYYEFAITSVKIGTLQSSPKDLLEF
jgi:hypothetical protein